jgi:REP element-mobilizing transposase RayT
MKYDPQKHHRRTIRLKGHDYTSPGAYFITICTHQRQCLFGKIVDGKMQLNEFGNWVDACWKRLPTHFSHLQLDRFVVMPNHIHGILVLTHNPNEPTPTNGRGAAFGRTSMQLFTMLRPNATPGSEDRSQFANPDCPNPIYPNATPGSDQDRSQFTNPNCPNPIYPNATPGSEDRSQFTNPDCPDPIYPNATPGSEDRSHFVDPVCSDTLPNSDQPSMNESESDMAFGREMVALVGCVPFHNPIANPTFIMERTIPN